MTPDTDGLPNPLPRPPDELARLQAAWHQPGGWRWLSVVNNTQIGLLYIATAMLFLLLAGVLGLMMRAQLAIPDNALLSAATYNQVFTMHGTVMMFLFAVPIVEAIAVYLLPAMLGARDLPFPRLSAYAFWAYAIGGLGFFCSLFFGLAPDGGWFMYPPLTSREHSPGLNADFWLLGIGFIEISAIAGAIELIIGIVMMRPPGMTLRLMPIFAWSMLVTAMMIILAFPAIIAGTTLLEMERAFDWPIFEATRGGDPLLWQHLFWFFGHPEVYIIFLPAAGLVSTMVPTLLRTRLVGHDAIVMALFAIGLLSFALWAHHMFTAGLGSLSLSLVSAASLAIALPAGVQIFAWLATIWKGRVSFDTPTLFLLGFLFTFVLGGLTGVMVAVLPFDWQVHDTYFIVAHFHYVIIGGVLFPVFAALYYWAPLVNGHRFSEAMGRWVFGLMFGGFHIAFFPMHITGMLGMPRRVYTYSSDMGWNLLNLISSTGAAVLTAGVALFLFDLVRVARRTEQPHGNPWNAPTLEWVPFGDYGTRSIPQIDSRYPLWDHPALSHEIEQGRHWLPGTATGRRETLVTTAISARPSHILMLPGYGWLPLLAAVGTAGFFLLLTIQAITPAFALGAVAIFCVWKWLGGTDQAPPLRTAEAAAGVSLPIGAHGRASHSWWATVILLVVDTSVLASMAFAHLHVAMLADVCPPPGARLPAGGPLGLAGALFIGSATAWWWAGRGRDQAVLPRWRGILFVLAAGMAIAAFLLGLDAYRDAGLEPTRMGWSATIAALLSYQGFHGVLLTLIALHLTVRAWSGRISPMRRATYDNCALLWHYSCAQGIFIMVLPVLVAAWMR
ncbi:MAG: cbb3-type cytochrome c oxidase subunit I [Burkholderiales bacterium]|nr:cbb3-type cytochrome c oxidase subunit I [Burkholderiales bacterium]